MLFTEPIFFAFFALVFTAHWNLRGHRARKLLLLGASYVFYAAWDWRFLGLILLSTLIDFIVGLQFRHDSPRFGRRFWLVISVSANLGILGLFKYYDFFVYSANSLLGPLGFDEVRALHLILPVGISFYTFQTMSYSIDLYRGQIRPISRFTDFALFVSFFPQLVMGPILRARRFLPQLEFRKTIQEVPFRSLLTLFLIGFVKKACVGDNIGPLVDSFYASPAAYDAMGSWIVMWFYAVQLYCDFSGYTDMAIAIAGMFGYHVERNFDFPFLSGNISEFWRRWHISFSSYMRDYFYFPIGGSKGGEARTHVNVMATMLVSGLWHGAGMTFLMWGALNGLGLSVHRAYQRLRWPRVVSRSIALLGVPLTFSWFAFTSIFFRSQSIGEAIAICRGLISPGVSEATMDPLLLLWFVPMGVAHWLSKRFEPTQWVRGVSVDVFAVAYGFAVVLAVAFVRLEYRPFIYFQF